MILFGGLLVTICGVGLVALGHPVGWIVAVAGFVAMLAGAYRGMR
jgi:hypothetical protein